MWLADSPTELAQPCVADPEVMTHLVNDRPPNLLDDLGISVTQFTLACCVAAWSAVLTLRDSPRDRSCYQFCYQHDRRRFRHRTRRSARGTTLQRSRVVVGTHMDHLSVDVSRQPRLSGSLRRPTLGFVLFNTFGFPNDGGDAPRKPGPPPIAPVMMLAEQFKPDSNG